ncbi:hypothetical protein GM921_07860 [Pedobacter sp. LMG 31464]|uniref:Uncharacterized protein n=1 Tax=Pedobacter planticolens TaxID=2679964 RepID=A0A923IVQ3_9SPHI|nr:hypothetical protein [Pedobacter planticolens]MBB2145394.1 hypothetical protein [Pedobacter planticolens]
MIENNKYLKKLRIITFAFGIIAILSSYSLSVTTFAYGTGDNTLLILLLYPILIISTILIIVKVRFGFYLTLATSLMYSILLTQEVEKYIIFDTQNIILLPVLLLPYVCFIILISLTIIYLTANLKYWLRWRTASMICAVGFFIFIIIDAYSKNYNDTIFIDAEIGNGGNIKLNCKPGFGDARVFVINVESKLLEKEIKANGEYYQGSYFLSNTKIIKNFRFNKLRSITIKKIGNHKLSQELTWNKEKLKGELEFLYP